MFSNVHGVVGTLLVVGTFALTGSLPVAIVLGGILAFLSHDILDRLGERTFGSIKQMAIFEAISLLVFMFAAWMSGLWVLYAVGWVMGNMMDIIDKKGYLSIIFPAKFGPSWTFFPCHRRKPDIMFTAGQTKLASYIASILILIA